MLLSGGGWLATAVPDQGECVGVVVSEEAGVDRTSKARVVDLDRKIVAAFGGASRPGGADLGVMWCTT